MFKSLDEAIANYSQLVKV